MAIAFYRGVELGDIFEGTMDLLVYLIKKHEVDIYDIPIAKITDHYLKYIDLIKLMNIDLAGDFILMAASLAQIKSRMFLPSYEDETEDPRLEIIKPLEEYILMKSAERRYFYQEPIYKRLVDQQRR